MENTIFQPSFGNRPNQYIGRDDIIERFIQGLQEPSGSRNRCTLFLGQRGMGKTALLLELGDRAVEEGFVVARVTAIEGMPKAIIEQVISINIFVILGVFLNNGMCVVLWRRIVNFAVREYVSALWKQSIERMRPQRPTSCT